MQTPLEELRHIISQMEAHNRKEEKPDLLLALWIEDLESIHRVVAESLAWVASNAKSP